MAIELGVFGANAPPRSQVGYLDPSIANEGMKIRMDDSDGGEIIGDPAPKIIFPDISKLKALRKYFNRTGYQVFPSWIYNHETGEERIVKNATEAAEFGIVFRETTMEERAAFGVRHRWDSTTPNDARNAGRQIWRTIPPFRKRVISDQNTEGGKNFVARSIATSYDQDAMIARTVASVLAAMKASGPSAPPSADPAQWQKFLEFQAFQEATKVVTETALAASGDVEEEEEPLIIHDMHEADGDPRAKWMAEAERLGIKVDGRWSLTRLIEECQTTP